MTTIICSMTHSKNALAPLRSHHKVLQTSANIESIVWLVGTQSNRQSFCEEMCIQTFIPRPFALAFWCILDCWWRPSKLIFEIWVQRHFALWPWLWKMVSVLQYAAVNRDSAPSVKVLCQAEEPDFNVENEEIWSKINKTNTFLKNILNICWGKTRWHFGPITTRFDHVRSK